jgi:hypothetical protein
VLDLVTSDETNWFWSRDVLIYAAWREKISATAWEHKLFADSNLCRFFWQFGHAFNARDASAFIYSFSFAGLEWKNQHFDFGRRSSKDYDAIV